MYLKKHIANLDKKNNRLSFSGISFDSTKVKKNYIFFAIRGNNLDGNNYIDQAIKKGAKIIISEREIEKKKDNVLYIKSKNVRKLLAKISYGILNRQPKKLIAVTGTNGKSSVADFYNQILNLNSKSVASIGTIGVKYKKFKNILNNTTLDPIQLSSILNNLNKRKINYIILEASSHGLKQNRLDGLLFDIGIFTNLSHDHLDYHKNMRDYLNSKLYLFDQLIKKGGEIISDANIPQIKRIKKISLKKKLNLNLIFHKTKGIELLSHKFENAKQILEILFKKRKYKFEVNLIGKIQIKNILMAVLAASKSDIKFKKIINILPKIKPVEGRLENVGKIFNKSKVILDYAHTPEALELALSNLKEQFPQSDLSLVFGCGGNRDFKKRSIMGKIAEKYSKKIYLTDDNPRHENPKKIRNDIKKGIKKTNIVEIPDRKKAINYAIQNLKSGDILLIAGKGHEKSQDYGIKKLFFSDKEIIFNSIKSKNKSLSKNLKINIISEQSNKRLPANLVIKNVSINSKTIKKDDIFFAIKGKKLNGSKFLPEAFQKKCSLAIVNQIQKKIPSIKQVRVSNTLNFLTKCSRIFRQNIDTKIITITGSCGKTTLKEMMGNILKKISNTTSSPKSFNNKYGVPVSLMNLRQNDDFGVLEAGMDKKGEIDNLTKIIKPDLGIITNISYAHSKNFKNIRLIADAKAEIIQNINTNGTLILNADDKFFKYHKDIAYKKKLNVLSFSIKNKLSFAKLIKIKKINTKKYELFIRIGKFIFTFYSLNKNNSNLYNILATLIVVNLYSNLKKLKKDIFLNFKIPEGRGDTSKIKTKDKNIFLVDETYNSNPLSLKTAIENYAKIKSNKSKKILILGDMLELGSHSITQHKLISKIINKTNIDKVFVIGKYIKETFKGLKTNKKAKILTKKSDIIELINKDLNNNDYLMIKGSNATGLNKITQNLKQRNVNVI